MFKKSAFLIIFISLSALKPTFSQLPLINVAFSGGPSAGWFFNNVDDLNAELTKAGFPELPKNGFLTLGGNGFIDIELQKRSNFYIRIGGYGLGLTSHKDQKINDTLSKAVTYGFGIGGISVELVKSLSKRIDISAGIQFGAGTLLIDLYQYKNNYGNYGTIWGEFQNSSNSNNITRNFRNHLFSVEPQIGIGLFFLRAVYIRLQAGYHLAALGKWKVDNDIEVKNFPSGIKANGFKLNIGLNFGLFFRDE